MGRGGSVSVGRVDWFMSGEVAAWVIDVGLSGSVADLLCDNVADFNTSVRVMLCLEPVVLL